MALVLRHALLRAAVVALVYEVTELHALCCRNALLAVFVYIIALTYGALGCCQTHLQVAIIVDIIWICTFLLRDALRLVASCIEVREVTVTFVDIFLFIEVSIRLRLLCTALSG